MKKGLLFTSLAVLSMATAPLASAQDATVDAGAGTDVTAPATGDTTTPATGTDTVDNGAGDATGGDTTGGDATDNTGGDATGGDAGSTDAGSTDSGSTEGGSTEGDSTDTGSTNTGSETGATEDIRTLVRTEAIKYETETISDKTKPEGIVTEGIDGVQKVTYEVTYVNGRPTTAKRVSAEVTLRPVNEVVNKHNVEASSTSSEAKENKTNENRPTQGGGTTSAQNPATSPAPATKSGNKELPAAGEASTLLNAIGTVLAGMGGIFVKRRK